MNWNEYSKLALRTESIPDNTYGQIPVPNDNFDMAEEREIAKVTYEKATRLLHAAMGLVTETDELEDYKDKVNLIEEIGDCFWYLPIITDVIPEFNIRPLLAGRLASGSPEYNLRACRRYAAELIDLIGKRHIFYGKELDLTKVISAAESYTYYLVRYCTVMKIDLEHTWEANIKKLEKRYPDLRFNGEHAVNRNVANELSHIEQSVDMESKDQAYIEPTYEVALDGHGELEVTAKGFNSILRNDFTPNEIERIAMGLSFELGNKFKAAGMDILATAMGGVYREYSGRGDKLADNTVFGMYEMMGYPKTVEAILAIANSILRKPKDASNNSSAG